MIITANNIVPANGQFSDHSIMDTARTPWMGIEPWIRRTAWIMQEITLYKNFSSTPDFNSGLVVDITLSVKLQPFIDLSFFTSRCEIVGLARTPPLAKITVPNLNILTVYELNTMMSPSPDDKPFQNHIFYIFKKNRFAVCLIATQPFSFPHGITDIAFSGS